MPKGFVYILECADGSYYTGSTIDIEKRLIEHQEGKGANHTKKRLPVALVFLEEFQRIDDAFYREKQIQGWSRAKKEALIENNFDKLPSLSIAYRDKQLVPEALEGTNENNNKVASRTSATKYSIMLAERSRSHKQASESLSTFYSSGKLLISGEYVVLDGTKALALPTRFGQSLTVKPNSSETIRWKSFDENGNLWFECNLSAENFGILHNAMNDISISNRLVQILKAVQSLNPSFLNNNQGFDVQTHLDFNRLWGLGTSSTLINNIANWANVDAYELLENTFGGSGYDIACAQKDSPLTYYLNGNKREVIPVDFKPPFSEYLHFVYLNQKQNSRTGILSYKKQAKINATTINEISDITDKLISCKSLSEFQELIEKHEEIISQLINQKPIKNKLFSDFDGSIKSLGAWGGDFVLVASKSKPHAYFKSRGFDTILSFNDMVLN